jgi:hypothetical protein
VGGQPALQVRRAKVTLFPTGRYGRRDMLVSGGRRIPWRSA